MPVVLNLACPGLVVALVLAMAWVLANHSGTVAWVLAMAWGMAMAWVLAMARGLALAWVLANNSGSVAWVLAMA